MSIWRIQHHNTYNISSHLHHFRPQPFHTGIICTFSVNRTKVGKITDIALVVISVPVNDAAEETMSAKKKPIPLDPQGNILVNNLLGN